MTPLQQYISEWHDNFVKYIEGLLGFITTLIVLPQATDEDKRAFDQIKLILKGKDAKEIEQNLASGIVNNDTLERIEKLDKDLVDLTVEHLTAAPLVKLFLKQLSYRRIEQNKRETIMKLHELQLQ